MTASKLKRFEDVLDIYGAEPSRWPGNERVGLLALLGRDPNARKLHDEALALDTLMSHSRVEPAGEGLKAAILASALGDDGKEARVIPIGAVRKSAASGMSNRRIGTMWPAAALAASFAFGLYLGITDIGGRTYDSALQIADIASGSESEDAGWLSDGSGSDTESML